MAIGGFNGSDPSPTLAQFQAVRRRRRDPLLHRQRRRRRREPPAAATQHARSPTWVAASFTATTVDGVTLYDLSGGVQ